ncbi:tRNA glutamyl-Q(34) synthetase GluQRS [Rhodobacteraceae bacterium nBUS_24]
MTFTTRLAPSPTGPLHLGHAYSALLAHQMAAEAGGRFLLRIEDTDQSRARAQWEKLIFDDLTWLGLRWETPVRRQSDHLASYSNALKKIDKKQLIYPCNCRRADIEAAAGAPQEGVAQFGPDGRIYSGTCRHRTMRDAGAEDALRLNMQLAIETLAAPLLYHETGLDSGPQKVRPEALLSQVGDVVLQRRNGQTAYHLAVVVDDAIQGVSDVVRGADLAEATQIHVLLQSLLGLPTPRYHHHKLIRDSAGKRLAKRDDATAISTLRSQGQSANDIRRSLGFKPLE